MGFEVAVPRVEASHHVWEGDFPDPEVVWTGGHYVALSTASAGVNVPAMASADLRSWRPLPDALPVVPAWSEPGHTWAPALLRRGERWVLYYATRERASGLQVVSAAVGDSAAGPFLDRSTGPLVAHRERGGAIDPSPYLAPDGTAYLAWKSDDNARGRPSTLWAARLRPDGLAVSSEPAPLLHQDRRWHHPTLEAPALVPVGDAFLLFYSAGSWAHGSYAVGVAACDGPLGPARNLSRRRPWLASGPLLAGPGGASAFRDAEGRWRLALHAWAPGAVGYPRGARSLWILPLAPPTAP